MRFQNNSNCGSRVLGRSGVLRTLGYELCKGFRAHDGQSYRVCSPRERRSKMQLASTVLISDEANL